MLCKVLSVKSDGVHEKNAPIHQSVSLQELSNKPDIIRLGTLFTLLYMTVSTTDLSPHSLGPPSFYNLSALFSFDNAYCVYLFSIPTTKVSSLSVNDSSEHLLISMEDLMDVFDVC